MADTAAVGLRIPSEWLDEINALCEETGKTKTQVVLEAVGHYLGKNSVGGINLQLQEMQKVLQTHQKRLEELENKVTPLEVLTVEQPLAESTNVFQSAADSKTPVLASTDVALLAETLDNVIYSKQAALGREQVALHQAQKALGRAKRSTTQQAKQAEIEGMRERIANWQREIENLERVKERLTYVSGI